MSTTPAMTPISRTRPTLKRRSTMECRNQTSRLLVVSIFSIGILLLFVTPAQCTSLTSASGLSRRDSLLAKKHDGQSRRSKAFVTKSDVFLHDGKLRGGAILGGNRQREKSSSEVSTKPQNKAVGAGTLLTIAVAVILSVLNWETLKTSFLNFFDREKFRKSIIQKLNEVAAKGHKGLVMYAIGFCFYEVCGLPTSVVETAAGMAFGFKEGLLGSFIGKTCGSTLAFVLGRTLLSRAVQKQMDQNETLQLIDKSVARHPVKSALIVRYSVFPQLVKNFGLSMTKPVTLPIFIAAIIIHGFPFSVLWATLGNDSSMRLRASELGESMATNKILNGFLVFVTFFGFVVSPAVTGWWLADLRNES